MLILYALLLSMAFSAQTQFVSTRTAHFATGTIFQITSTPAPGSQGESWLYLKTDGGDTYRLSFCSEVSTEDIAPNTRVTVSYSRLEAGVMFSCQPPRQDSRNQESARRQLLSTNAVTPTKPTFLIYIVTLCGFNEPAAITPKEMEDVFTGQGLNSSGRTMSGYYDTCSFGQLTVQPSQVRVLGPISIPCSGSLSLPWSFPTGNDFDSKSCDNDNRLKWQYYLDTVAAKQGVRGTDYHHKIIIMPKRFFRDAPGCKGISGQGTAGPLHNVYSDVNNWGTGLVWMAGEAANDVEALFHEVGHNMGMAHANTQEGCGRNSDQCDHLCVMGAVRGQGIRCLNPPHLWQMGWGQPLEELTEQNLLVGKARVLTIPPQMKTADSFVTADLPGMDPNQRLYFAARTNKYDYDLPYSNQTDGKAFLTVHGYNGTALKPYVATVFMSEISPGQTYFHAPSGLVVYFLDWDPKGGASALFCVRRGATESNCSDNLDDDCDFLPDHLDLDCVDSTRSPPFPPLLRPTLPPSFPIPSSSRKAPPSPPRSPPPPSSHSPPPSPPLNPPPSPPHSPPPSPISPMPPQQRGPSSMPAPPSRSPFPRPRSPPAASPPARSPSASIPPRPQSRSPKPALGASPPPRKTRRMAA